MPGAKPVGPIDPASRAEVTIRLRPKRSAARSVRKALKMAEELPARREYLSREEFAAVCGADAADLRKIDDFARENNLTVVDVNVAARTVRVSGALGDLSAAFGAKLREYECEGVRYRGRTGPLSLPALLTGVVEAVHGLDNRPVAKPHYRVLGGSKKKASRRPATPRNAPDGSFRTPELARLYNFPTGLDGGGQCVALIELNDIDQNGKATGTGFEVSDLNTYFRSLGLPLPAVVAIGVDGGANVPGPNPGADGEVALDIEVAGAIAPGAQIAVYFAPNTTAGFIDAVSAALHDAVRKPSIISISWGGPEDSATQQFLDGLQQAFQDAATLGVTVCCASGDNGSADMGIQGWDRKPHADFPASAPFALGCGGTKLTGAGAAISSEVVWNEGRAGGATGGGVSNVFARPRYQSGAGIPKSPAGKTGRGVPDVAGDADPATGYQVFVGGEASVFGGTSAVAPLWAGLVALINQRLVSKRSKPVGFLNPLLYGSLAAAGVVNDITKGNNDIDGVLRGVYEAGAGWDACTGLGTPNGAKLLKALGG
jgi:kumamolisin